MRYSYLALTVLLGLVGQRAQGQATAWRPFRPGLVYGYAQAGSTGASLAVHTLRVDSAYATAGGDSVYTFNRLMRQPAGTASLYLKSRNNLFGARLRWQANTGNYYLETNAEAALNGAVATSLLLRPHAAIGSSWAASTQPALTATLSSRTYGQVGITPDSLATITLSNGQQLVMSKHYGLVQGPQWLTLATGSSAATTWYQPTAAQAGLGAYDPRTLFAMQPGAVLGYYLEDSPVINAFICGSGYLLRRILSRQVTADSLAITYQEQQRFTRGNAPGCSGTPGTTTGPVRQGRWVFSLRTGASKQFPGLGLLTNEYRPIAYLSSSSAVDFGYTYQLDPATNTVQLTYSSLFLPAGSTVAYSWLIDNPHGVRFSTAIGPVTSFDSFKFQQDFYCPAGATCPPPANYALLLPTRAAQAATLAALYPNPAQEAATLTFATPARAAATLTLSDALGRLVWQGAVAPGQAAATVPLAGRPAGLYLVQLGATAGTPATTWKLTHE